MYTATYRVSFQTLDYCGKLSLVRLLNFAQQTTGLDCATVGLDQRDLNKKGIAWVLLANSIRITDDLPGEYDYVKVDTWSSGSRGARFTRQTVISTKCKENDTWREFARGSSEWALTERFAAIPVKPDSVVDRETVDAWSCSDIALIERIPKLRQPAGEVVRLAAVPIFVSDLDPNRHVHNAEYVRMGIDRLAEMIGLNARETDLTVREFCIRYVAETKLGETLEWYAVATGEGQVWLEAREQMTNEVKVRLTLDFETQSLQI